MQKVLKQVGIKTFATKDGLKIFVKDLLKLIIRNCCSKTWDHQICMSSFILALLTEQKLKLKVLKLHLITLFENYEIFRSKFETQDKFFKFHVMVVQQRANLRCENDFKI